MINGSLQTELNRFLPILEDKPVASAHVSAAAFSKARNKISHTTFKALNNCLVDNLYASGAMKCWCGFRLLAVDATVARLPIADKLFSFYGKAREYSRYPAVRMSQLYDVINRVSIDVQVDSHRTGERNLALGHMQQLRENDLVILDRGYPAVWFFRKILQNKAHFCARVTNESINLTKDFLKSNEQDCLIEMPCIEKSLRRCVKEKLSTDPLQVRLIKIPLSSGETEILITSLTDKSLYPYDNFQKLYHQRWGVEEDYKVMKSRLNIENFSGKSVEAVLQDIHAKILTKNLAAVAAIDAENIKSEKVKNRRYQYRINFAHAIGLFKGNVVRLMLKLYKNSLCSQIIEKIATVLIPVRPGRSFKRPHNPRARVNKYPMPYKRTC